MKVLTILVICALFLSTSAQAQSSESTADWPAWKQVSLGVLGSSALLSTLALIGASNAESNSNEADSDSGDSQSGGNAGKSQGYVEELKDELLVLINEADRLSEPYTSDEALMDALIEDYPILIGYYKELSMVHPEVIEEANRVVPGETLVDRLNTVMLVHLFETQEDRPVR